jgi:hypothetical protein
MMTKFVWGGAKEKGIDIDYNHKRNLLVIKARYDYARLANALSSEGKNEKALGVLDYCMTTFPINKISYDMYVPDIVEAYVNAGAIEKATELTRDLSKYYFEKLDYYLKQKPDIIASAGYEVQTAIQFTSQAADACKTGGKAEFADEITNKLQSYYTKYVKIVQPGGR